MSAGICRLMILRKRLSWSMSKLGIRIRILSTVRRACRIPTICCGDQSFLVAYRFHLEVRQREVDCFAGREPHALDDRHRRSRLWTEPGTSGDDLRRLPGAGPTNGDESLESTKESRSPSERS